MKSAQLTGSEILLKTLQAQGVEVITAGADMPVQTVGELLASRGLTRVLVEGGSAVAGSFIKGEMVDEIAWFTAPVLIGGDGLAAVGELSASHIGAIPTFRRCENLVFAFDTLDMLVRKGP